jgi:hypothetical protein
MFAADVDLHGVHDWNPEIPNFAAAYDPAKNPDATRLAYKSSSMASVKTWRSPVLLEAYHAAADFFDHKLGQ